jgi:hypothetical protein
MPFVIPPFLSTIWATIWAIIGPAVTRLAGDRLRSTGLALGLTGGVIVAVMAVCALGRVLLHDPAPAITEAVRVAVAARDDAWTAQLRALEVTALQVLRDRDRAAAKAAAEIALEHERDIGHAADRIADLEADLADAAGSALVAYPRAVTRQLNR